ncbi:hypothetical protein LFYK43_14150 [Ligilactobacillus salitolerans]|uniref:Uncharacterized protein n=1 Tax=Ligilactobacillus salitolerans TaxID=1808352 RepID=A0A401ITX0_9LACO|nr:hypothetical protein [Ligilactobacillus salitolerans]GBG94956.1 hypothetical protein LFYK43_14150 [Ligilactobacillus salitolerans]
MNDLLTQIHNAFSSSREYLDRNHILNNEIIGELTNLENKAEAAAKLAHQNGISEGLQLAIKTATEGKNYGGTK